MHPQITSPLSIRFKAFLNDLVPPAVPSAEEITNGCNVMPDEYGELPKLALALVFRFAWKCEFFICSWEWSSGAVKRRQHSPQITQNFKTGAFTQHLNKCIRFLTWFHFAFKPRSHFTVRLFRDDFCYRALDGPYTCVPIWFISVNLFKLCAHIYTTISLRFMKPVM